MTLDLWGWAGNQTQVHSTHGRVLFLRSLQDYKSFRAPCSAWMWFQILSLPRAKELAKTLRVLTPNPNEVLLE